jgi:hypothetical protein
MLQHWIFPVYWRFCEFLFFQIIIFYSGGEILLEGGTVISTRVEIWLCQGEGQGVRLGFLGSLVVMSKGRITVTEIAHIYSVW